MAEPVPFVPLRTDPPPALETTLWIRSVLALAILATAVLLVALDVVDPGGGRTWTVLAVAAHGSVLALLVLWSGRAMANVEAILPPTRYGRTASGTMAGVLWVVGFAAPAVAAVGAARVGSEFAEPAAPVPTLATIGGVLAALVAAWTPFRYHLVHAQRIGAPWVVMAAWFWAPLLTFVAGAAGLALVYGGPPGTGPRADGLLGVGAVHGLAVAVFAWSTWRAVTVFDEVIDLRWQRWRIDWEQTLEAMAAQPAPGPERAAE